MPFFTPGLVSRIWLFTPRVIFLLYLSNVEDCVTIKSCSTPGHGVFLFPDIALYFFLYTCYFIYHCLQQADGDAEIKDGSFTEILASGAEKQSLNGTGKTSDIKLI